MPENVITAIAASGREKTLGSKSQMTGSASTPTIAVKTINTAVSLSWKYLSTRYLSMWVEIAHDNGPRIAKSSQRMSGDDIHGKPQCCRYVMDLVYRRFRA